VGSLRKVVASGDVDALCSVPGVGKRGAQRLILELKEKLGAVTESAHDGSTTAEVREALMSLGYSAAEVREALERIRSAGAPAGNGNTAGRAPEDSVENLVRAALKELARK
ncbi:MAG: helix-hairpin-helix domain-containing protein, partial [Acidimicrobiia bacterium]